MLNGCVVLCPVGGAKINAITYTIDINTTNTNTTNKTVAVNIY